MLFVTEGTARRVVSMKSAIDAVEACFLSHATGSAEVFPVVTCRGLGEYDEWAIKSGVDVRNRLLGAKVGSYWPGNSKEGIPPHASTVMLLSPRTGQVSAIVEASYLTCLRTAAADAVAVRHLARKDARSVAVIGAGHQAFYDLLAISEVRPVAQIFVWSRSPDNAQRFASKAIAKGLDAAVTTIEEALERADVVVTATPSREPLIREEWVRPGTHISAMGSDAPGKRELDPELVARSRFVADIPEQSVSIGEGQEPVRLGLIDPSHIPSLGSVIAGEADGRLLDEDITIFDSSGMALQDLAICDLALRLAVRDGLACELA